MQLINSDDYECLAKSMLEQSIFDYIASGANDEITLLRNRRAFNNIMLIPRVLRDVSHIVTDMQILDQRLSMPLLIAPTAFQCLVNPLGEIATVKAANLKKIGMVVSTLSTVSLEDIASASTSPLWFQLYFYKNRAISESLVQRAELCGYSAIVVTIDVPLMGRRESDIRNQFKLPPDLCAKNLKDSDLASMNCNQPGSHVKQYTDEHFDKALTWSDIAWLKSITKLPIILKGIMHPADAKLALDAEVAAIIISNHGGRQLDTMPATIDLLRSIATVVNQQIPILIDGGFRRGADIFKAIAWGADCVLLGRSILWALAAGGEHAVCSLIQGFHQELLETMTLCGCVSIDDIKKNGDDIVRLDNQW